MIFSPHSRLLAVVLSLFSAGTALAMRPPTAEELAALPPFPEKLPATVLASGAPPRLLPAGALERGRANVERYPWAAAWLKRQQEVAARFVGLDDDALRALVPPRGSLYVLGLGMNLDPVHRKRLHWAGWEKPFSVRAEDGRLYPNAEWPDDGSGVPDPKSRERFYFVAVANAVLTRTLETEVLPALADVYALTGSQRHAHAAAVLLDALAEAYPVSVRGPLDYPMGKSLRRYGGRLDRPTQQVARGVASYAQIIDLVAASGALDEPSYYHPGTTRREQIARNLLWDGGRYCLLFARQLEGLGNGMADFNYGAAVAGFLLGEPRFCEPLLSGPRRIGTMLKNNLIRQRFYFETSPAYEFFTLALYLRTADLVERLRDNGWTEHPSLYADPGARNYFTAPFARREVGGHIPLLGNTRVDSETTPDGDGTQARFRREGWLSTWHVLAQSGGAEAEEAAGWLKRNGSEPQEDRWLVYHYDAEKASAGKTASLEPLKPVFDGGKGVALLRGGSGESAHGLALFFGPSQVKSQHEALTWTAFDRGVEWSFDPGRFNAHFRFGWCASSVAHQSLVVDRKNVAMESGGGHLLAFGGDAAAQWALAAHPGAYREAGVTRFERFLAQVQERPGGRLLYWLDLGVVEGGERREESFHTQMQAVDFEPVPGWQPAGVSLYGDEDFGRKVTATYTLKGRREGFYWEPPGAGYGFLGEPRTARQEGALRTVWRNPAFFKEKGTSLVVDFPESATPRELIEARGPKAPGHPSVPYLLRSESGPGASLFAKVLHFADATGPRLNGVRQVPVTGGKALSGAWLVERRDGLRDLWVFNGSAGTPLRVNPPDLPPLETDGRITLLRLDARGVPLEATAEGATRLQVGEHEAVIGLAERTGTVRAIRESAEGVELDVAWEGEATPDFTGLLNLFPTVGQPSSWEIRSVDGSRVRLADASDRMGGGVATVDADGWLVFGHELSRFMVAGGVNTGLARGKPVYDAEGRLAGRIREIREGGTAIRLDTPCDGGELTLREVAAGDRVALPLRLHWKP